MSQLMWQQLQSRFPFRLSVVADEISDDFERTLVFAQELGIWDIEFKALWKEPLDSASQERLGKARDLLDSYEMQVCVLEPGTFKSLLLGDVPLDQMEDQPGFQEHVQRLRSQLAAAQFLGAPLVRVFSFRREGMVGSGNPSPRHPGGGPFPEEMQEKVARALRLACQEAERVEVTLALENVRSCWGDGGRNTALILERVDSPWLSVLWDPVSGFVSGEEDAYPAGYEAVRPYMSHVHLKDAVVDDEATGLTRWERIGDGDANLVEHLVALRDDGYAGCIGIETHWSPPGGDPESNTCRTYAGLMDLLAAI
jgi:sugar phosphate isomerase/epimerase